MDAYGLAVGNAVAVKTVAVACKLAGASSCLSRMTLPLVRCEVLLQVACCGAGGERLRRIRCLEPLLLALLCLACRRGLSLRD